MDRTNAFGSSRVGLPINTSFSSPSARLHQGLPCVKRPLSEIINMPAGRLRAMQQLNSDRNNNTRDPSVPSTQTAQILQTTPAAKPVVKLVKECICDRPKTKVVCDKCGFTCLGRVRTPCYVHHRLTYLLEMDACPKCHSHDLQEVKPTKPGD